MLKMSWSEENVLNITLISPLTRNEFVWHEQMNYAIQAGIITVEVIDEDLTDEDKKIFIEHGSKLASLIVNSNVFPKGIHIKFEFKTNLGEIYQEILVNVDVFLNDWADKKMLQDTNVIWKPDLVNQSKILDKIPKS
jgi:hypothetical protein